MTARLTTKWLLLAFTFLTLALPAFAMADSVSEPANERQVGLFYFLWLGEHGRRGPYDISKILAADPNAAANPDSPVWGPVGTFHHWGEPLYGYYFSDDEWVVRRHVKLLMQCDIDFLFFDVTNSAIYERNAKLVMSVLKEYHDAGWNPPKVMFYTNAGSGRTVERLYEAIYKPGFAKEVWFKLDGKPVVVAKKEQCSDEMKEFFTIVKPQWPNEGSKKGGWPWMDFRRPQRLFEGEDVAKTVMNVSVAHHLDVAGILVIRAIDEHDRTVGLPVITAGDPLVPVCYKNDVRLRLERRVPLLLEIISFLPCVRRWVVCAVVKRPPAVPGFAV